MAAMLCMCLCVCVLHMGNLYLCFYICTVILCAWYVHCICVCMNLYTRVCVSCVCVCVCVCVWSRQLVP